MKTVKLTKRLMRKSPADILIALGAVNSDKTRAYPSHVYFSKEDYRAMRKNVARLFKEERPYLSGRRLQSSVEMELLNYGPNEQLSTALRPGFALVDVESIDKEIAGGT